MTGTPGVSGSVFGTLDPFVPSHYTIAPQGQATVTASADVTTRYSFSVTDENGCESVNEYASIMVQGPAQSVNTTTEVIIGQQIQLNASVEGSFSYSWTPVKDNLSATNIPNPVSSTTANITYTVLITDEPLHCFVTAYSHTILVLPLTTVDVPTAFTPNGDGVNDIVYADGWGIIKLLYFKIINRWGQLIFESNDLRTGWDGTYQGVPQNTETYTYQVEVETYVDASPKIFKSGTVKLLR
jgi:gliding motility-associated-like protein